MKFRYLLLTFTLAWSVHPGARAASDDTWKDISNVGVVSLIGTALIMPATREDWEGLGQAAYSIGSATAAAQIGKALVHEERPNNKDNNSFPSGHTANAFASATTLHRRYGWEIGLPAYAMATLTGVARERAREHHWYDVVAGAAIGGVSGWFFTDAFNDKVRLTPWVDSTGAGVAVSMRW
ncbi:MAG: phosphatase PAP2 family protein [Halioglobus sp.]|nr:phosphatase PAP2 family protein [Halioglobus sp.]